MSVRCVILSAVFPEVAHFDGGSRGPVRESGAMKKARGIQREKQKHWFKCEFL